jgi:hypothetical protein
MPRPRFYMVTEIERIKTALAEGHAAEARRLRADLYRRALEAVESGHNEYGEPYFSATDAHNVLAVEKLAVPDEAG